MKKMQRFPAFVTALSVVFSCGLFCLSVNAEAVQTGTQTNAQNADFYLAEKLEAFGVIETAEGDLYQPVTRRQMAELTVTFMQAVETTDKTASPFVDVSVTDPSLAAITTLYKLGVVTGDDNLTFRPNDIVTGNEALVYIINAAGHKLFATKEGGYPTGYLRIATRLRMLAKTDFQNGTDGVTLINVYRMFEAALDAEAVVETNLSGTGADYSLSKTETFLSDTYGIKTYKGIVTGSENTRLTTPEGLGFDEQIEIDGVLYNTPGYVYATSLGHAVTYYIRTDAEGEEEIAYVEEDTKKNHVVTLDAEDLLPDRTTDDAIYYLDEKDKEHHEELGDNVDVIYNGKCYKGYGKIEYVLPEAGYIELLDNNGDERADVLFVYAYRNIVLDAADTYNESLTAKYTAEKLEWDYRSTDVKLYLAPEMRKTTFKGLKQWDVVTVLESKGTPKQVSLYISRNTVTGKVEEVSEEKGLFIGGNYYKLANDYYGTMPSVGETAVFRLDFTGKIVAADRASATQETVQYGVMTGIDYNTQSVANGITARIYTQNDEFVSLELADAVTIDGKRFSLAGGSGFDDVANVLSKGYKDGNGNYTVYSAYVISYTTSGGKLRTVDTGNTGTEGKLRQIATGDYFLSRTNAILRIGESNFSYVSYVPNEVYVFSTPADGNLSETDKYDVRRTLNQATFYKDTSKYGTDHATGITTFDMYDLGSDEGVKTANVILLRGNRTAAGLSDTGSKFKVLTKITAAVDSEGNASQKLYFNESESFCLAERVTVKRGSDYKTYAGSADLGSVLKPGYVVQYGFDITGNEIEAISIMAEYDADTGVLTPVFTEEKLGNTANGYAKVAGTVLSCDTSRGIITFRMSDGTESMLFAANAGIVVYRSENEKAASVALSDVAAGDAIAARVTGYYAANEIIVLR